MAGVVMRLSDLFLFVTLFIVLVGAFVWVWPLG